MVKVFARVAHVNIRFYRLPDTKPTFRLPPPDLPVRSVMQKQTGGSRLYSGRLKLQSAFPKADIVNKPETRDILPGRYRETSDVQDQHPFWDAT